MSWWEGRWGHTVCDDEGEVADAAVRCGGASDGLEVDGEVVKQDEEPTRQA